MTSLRKASRVNDFVRVKANSATPLSPRVKHMQGLISLTLENTTEQQRDPTTIPAYTTDPRVPNYRSLMPMSSFIYYEHPGSVPWSILQSTLPRNIMKNITDIRFLS